MQSDRELISAALKIQTDRDWSGSRTSRLMNIGASTWVHAVDTQSPVITPSVRGRIAAFVAEWSDASKPGPVQLHELLAAECRNIQTRRDWSISQCSRLSGVSRATWRRLVIQGKQVTWCEATAKLQSFVDRWSDASTPDPALPVTQNRGLRFGRSKVTPVLRLVILSSDQPGTKLGPELGLSSATIYRVRASA